MKGVKSIRVDNFEAYPQVVCSFDRYGESLEPSSPRYVSFIVDYLLNGKFLITPTFSDKYVYHKPKKLDVNKAPRIKNLYIKLELHSKSDNPVLMELYAYGREDKKDYIKYTFGGKSYVFYVSDGDLNLELNYLIVREMISASFS